MRKEKQFLPDLKDGVSLRGVMKIPQQVDVLILVIPPEKL